MALAASVITSLSVVMHADGALLSTYNVSLVPAGAAKGDLNPICYQLPNATYADKVHTTDPVARRHTEQLNASCADFGYSFYLGNDPVFKDAVLFRRHKTGEAAVELAD